MLHACEALTQHSTKHLRFPLSNAKDCNERILKFSQAPSSVVGKQSLVLESGGDSSFYFENPDHSDSKNFEDLLFSLNLDQHRKTALIFTVTVWI